MATSTTETDPVKFYASYPFESDEVFQQGLSSLLSSGVLSRDDNDSQESNLRRAKIFYFKRVTGYDISEADAQLAEASTSQSPPASSDVIVENEPSHLSFAQLKELIELGKTDQIPNNKHIPEAFHHAPPTKSKAPPRKKPWEMIATVGRDTDVQG